MSGSGFIPCPSCSQACSPTVAPSLSFSGSGRKDERCDPEPALRLLLLFHAWIGSIRPRDAHQCLRCSNRSSRAGAGADAQRRAARGCHHVVRIVHLRGELISTSPTKPPVFDDRRSFKVRVDSGEIAVDSAALTQLLNHYLFSYKGSPLRDLKVTTEEGRLRIEGELRKGVPIPFSMLAEPSVTPDGTLRLHPTKVNALGIPDQAPDVDVRAGTGQPDLAETTPVGRASTATTSCSIRPPSCRRRRSKDAFSRSHRRRQHRSTIRSRPAARVEASGSGRRQLHVLLGRHAEIRQADHDRH